MIVHTCNLSASGVNTGVSLCLVNTHIYLHTCMWTRKHTHITKYKHTHVRRDSRRNPEWAKSWVNVYCCWNRHNHRKASKDSGPLALAKSFPIRLRLLKVKLSSEVRIWAMETEELMKLKTSSFNFFLQNVYSPRLIAYRDLLLKLVNSSPCCIW